MIQGTHERPNTHDPSRTFAGYGECLLVVPAFCSTTTHHENQQLSDHHETIVMKNPKPLLGNRVHTKMVRFLEMRAGSLGFSVLRSWRT
jgi:hypothetical protein